MSRAHYISYALDDAGEAIASMTVDLFNAGTANHIGQTIYADRTSGTIKTNPFTADADGRVEFFLDDAADIDIQVSKAGATTQIFPAVVNPALVLGTDSDITDTGSANASGTTGKIADAGHVHKHPVYVTGGLHTDYLAIVNHVVSQHNSMGITPGAHAASHAPGGSDEVATGGGGGGGTGFSASFAYFIYKSGSNYFCVRTIDNTLITSNAPSVHTAVNAAANAIQAASTNGGGIVMGDYLFTTTGTCNLVGGARMVGSKGGSGGANLGPLIRAASGLGSNPVITLSSTGSGIQGLNVDGGFIANNTVRCFTQEWNVWDSFLQGGTLRTWYADPLTSGGPARGRFGNVRCDGGNAPSVAVIEMNSSDHLGAVITATGGGPGCQSFVVNGQHGQYSSMHCTGDSGSGSPVVVNGAGNSFSSVFGDCPGSASQGAFLVTANDNKFQGCGAMNPPVTTKPLITIRGNIENTSFVGAYSESGAAGGQWNGLVNFLTSGGAAPGSLANYGGTHIQGSGTNMAQQSGGPNYTNMASIPTNVHVCIMWHAGSGGQYVYPVTGA